MVMEYFTHGSSDSLDVDVLFVVDALHDNKHNNKILCETLSHGMGVNGNIITIDPKQHVVTGVFKGTRDEVQNGLFYTYHLHKQHFPCPVDYALPRDVHLKMIRVMRGLLSMCSRTEHRVLVKNALHSEFIHNKLDALNTIKFSAITEYGAQKSQIVDVHKFIAFQIIQFLGLMRYPMNEIFTKSQAAIFYPNARDLLYRSGAFNGQVLAALQDDFLQACHTLLDNKRTINLLQDGKLIRTPFGRLNVKTELYEKDL